MPSQEESDEFSDSDPWGSDFETEDDITDAGSIRTQEDLNDEDEEEDPYDSVEISPMRERRRPVIINITIACLLIFCNSDY